MGCTSGFPWGLSRGRDPFLPRQAAWRIPGRSRPHPGPRDGRCWGVPAVVPWGCSAVPARPVKSLLSRDGGLPLDQGAPRPSGGIGRRAGFRFQWLWLWGFKSPGGHRERFRASGGSRAPQGCSQLSQPGLSWDPVGLRWQVPRPGAWPPVQDPRALMAAWIREAGDAAGWLPQPAVRRKLA